MLKKKIRLTPTTAGILIAFYTTMTPILAKPKPNTEGIKNEAKPWLDSARDIGLWLIPLTGLVACIVHTVTWMTKDEDEKSQKPVWKMLKKIIGFTIGGEMLTVLWKLLRL